MSELSFHQQSVLWGQTYEVLVKRGGLAYLLEQRLIDAERPSLKPWRETKLLAVSSHLTNSLELLDETARDVVKAAVRHLALTGYGVGYTAMRAYVDSVRAHFKNPDFLKVRALWAPLQLPGESTAEGSTTFDSKAVSSSAAWLERRWRNARDSPRRSFRPRIPVQPAMATKFIDFERNKLYEQVWTQALGQVAQSYGVSNAEVKRAAEVLAIPLLPSVIGPRWRTSKAR